MTRRENLRELIASRKFRPANLHELVASRKFLPANLRELVASWKFRPVNLHELVASRKWGLQNHIFCRKSENSFLQIVSNSSQTGNYFAQIAGICRKPEIVSRKLQELVANRKWSL